MQVILLFVCPIVKNFKKILMRCLAMGSIVVYHTTIIPNTLDKVANCMELKIFKDWLV